MKIVIITFSPSGTTLQVGEMIKQSFLRFNCEVQLIDLTRMKNFFLKGKEVYTEDIN